MNADDPSVAVGSIARAHGVRGEVAVRVLSDNPERFAPGSRVFTDGGRALVVATSRRHGARLLVRFEGVEDRRGADELRGRTLLVPGSELPELPEGSYWPHELEGCVVVVEGSERSLGTVREVLHTRANDVWVAVDEGRETLIPALRDVIVSVDVRAKRVVVAPVPGLTVPEPDEA